MRTFPESNDQGEARADELVTSTAATEEGGHIIWGTLSDPISSMNSQSETSEGSEYLAGLRKQRREQAGRIQRNLRNQIRLQREAEEEEEEERGEQARLNLEGITFVDSSSPSSGTPRKEFNASTCQNGGDSDEDAEPAGAAQREDISFRASSSSKGAFLVSGMLELEPTSAAAYAGHLPDLQTTLPHEADASNIATQAGYFAAGSQAVSPPPPTLNDVGGPGADAAGREQEHSEGGSNRLEAAVDSVAEDMTTMLRNLPSVGSANHYAGNCRPCSLVLQKLCMRGDSCWYCHFPHPQEESRPGKKNRFRAKARILKAQRAVAMAKSGATDASGSGTQRAPDDGVARMSF